jgi:hypothetical protein
MTSLAHVTAPRQYQYLRRRSVVEFNEGKFQPKHYATAKAHQEYSTAARDEGFSPAEAERACRGEAPACQATHIAGVSRHSGESAAAPGQRGTRGRRSLGASWLVRRAVFHSTPSMYHRRTDPGHRLQVIKGTDHQIFRCLPRLAGCYTPRAHRRYAAL